MSAVFSLDDSNSKIPLLVSTQWLHQMLPKASTLNDIRILQAKYPDHCFSEDLIPNSRLFEGEKCETKCVLHNMFPTPEQFERYVGESLGIENDTHVIVYDASTPDKGGLEAAPRLWYTFKLFGHDNVSVLNGGLSKWLKEGRPTTKQQLANVKPVTYKVKKFRSDLVVDYDQMEKIIQENSHHVIDSRSKKRFAGQPDAPEPAGGKSGAMPSSVNLPFTKLVNPETLEFLDKTSLEKLFQELNVDHSKPFLATCGTGTTCCGLNLANAMLGHDIGHLYDGSWFEYSRKTGVNLWP